jgi:hypothetical protein
MATVCVEVDATPPPFCCKLLLLLAISSAMHSSGSLRCRHCATNDVVTQPCCIPASLQTHKAQHGTAWRGTAWFCIVEHLTHCNVCTLDTMTFQAVFAAGTVLRQCGHTTVLHSSNAAEAQGIAWHKAWRSTAYSNAWWSTSHTLVRVLSLLYSACVWRMHAIHWLVEASIAVRWQPGADVLPSHTPTWFGGGTGREVGRYAMVSAPPQESNLSLM